MAGKRVRGSVRQLASGRWQVRYTGPDGRRRSLPQTYRTKADADAGWSITAAELSRGRWIDPDRARVTLGVYLDRWVAERAGLSARTQDLYESLARLHVKPYLGSVQLRHLAPEMVRQWRQDRLDAGVGPSTMSKAYRLLRAACMTAVDDELLVRNPCRIRGAGVEAAPERPVLRIEEVLRLADEITPHYRLLVLLASFGSLRWGELLGLTGADVDLADLAVTVRRSVAEVAGKLVVKTPKSTAGFRRVALPEFLREEVAYHLGHYAEPGPVGRVFVGPKGATPHRTHFTKPWRAAKKAAGVDQAVHLHDLRHTGNHLAATSGASTRELMARMGHSSMRAALIYQHATAQRDRAIANALDRMIVDSATAESGLRPQDRARIGHAPPVPEGEPSGR